MDQTVGTYSGSYSPSVSWASVAHSHRTAESPFTHREKLFFTGSSILQETKLQLSPELNSAIGGRGSGKSSLFEYLSFGLGRSCRDLPRNHYPGTERLKDLLNDTPVEKNGRILLLIEQDSAVFQVERAPSNSYQPIVTFPDGEKQTVSEKELRSLFQAVVYSQGELSEIGKRTAQKAQLSDLLQFVNPEYKREDDRLAQDIQTAKDSVKTKIQELASHWRLNAQMRRLKNDRTHVCNA